MIEEQVLNRIIQQVESEETDSPGRVLLEELRERQFRLELQNKQLTEAQFEIERSRDLYANLYDYSPVGLVTVDTMGFIKNINFTCAQFLGYEREQLINKPFYIYLNKDSYPVFINYLKKCCSSEPSSAELTLKGKDDKQINIQIYSSMVTDSVSGEEVIHSTIIDITDKKEAEQVISKSLKEKMILLKEVHHRVKNNLQIISSLLNLQSNFMKSDELYEILLTSRNRVRAMALVHEKLYKTSSLSEISIDDYLNDLARNLFDSYKAFQNRIALKLDVKNIMINVDKGITVGLIVNELITNSIKHAFKDRQEGGVVEVNLENLDKGMHLLVIKDNGVGLPEAINPQTAETLGFQLVSSLVEQLKGTMEITRKKGTVVAIQF